MCTTKKFNVPEARPSPAPATRTGAAIPAVITVITPPAMVNVPARIPPPLPTTLNVSIFSYNFWKMFENHNSSKTKVLENLNLFI